MPCVGVITNPGSHRNKRRTDPLIEGLEKAGRLTHTTLATIDEIPEILAEFARREVGTVVVSGGDGTVQAVLTELYRSRPFAEIPRLAVIPRGMTNMIAADVGLGRGGLGRLVEAAETDSVDRISVRRHILRVENARGHRPQYGMFFGGAAIYRAIMACRSDIHPYRIGGEAAAAVTLAGTLIRSLFRIRHRGSDDDPASRGRILSGDRMKVGIDDETPNAVVNLVVLATTLDRLILGSRPFWNGGAGDLRFTSIAYPATNMLRNALRVLYGGEARDLPADSYCSRAANRISLKMDSPFTIDGELFEPDPDTPLILTAADQARFVRI